MIRRNRNTNGSPMARTLAAASLAGCLLQSACSPGTTFPSAKMNVPAAWKQSGSFPVASPSQDLSRWWGRFNDPTLTQLISRGLQNSPNMEEAVAKVREARSRKDAEQASLLPYVGADLSSGIRRTDTDTSPSFSTQSHSAGLNASWDADLFGKRRSTLEVAAANLGVANENLHSVQAGLAAEIAATYTTLRANEARLTVLKRNISTREQTTQLAIWKLKAGEADALEASQAQSSLETARSGIPALQQAISQGRNNLANLCGLNPGALDAMLAKSSRGIPNPSSSLTVGIPADTLRQRPDVRVAGYQVIAATAATKAADAARYPSLNLSGNIGATALKAGDIFNPQTVAAGVAGDLAAPVFDGGRLRSNADAARAVRDQSIANYRTTVLAALTETENAMIACQRSTERLASLEKATEHAREADSLARQRYQAGEIDFTNVLDTQRVLLGLEDNLVSTRADRTTAHIRLYQALGGGHG